MLVAYFTFFTKSALNKFTTDYKVIELEDRDDMDDIQDYLREITGARSVNKFALCNTFYSYTRAGTTRFYQWQMHWRW